MSKCAVNTDGEMIGSVTDLFKMTSPWPIISWLGKMLDFSKFRLLTPAQKKFMVPSV